jgi:hypothetical protein
VHLSPDGTHTRSFSENFVAVTYLQKIGTHARELPETRTRCAGLFPWKRQRASRLHELSESCEATQYLN